MARPQNNRSLSQALQALRSQEEQETLLNEDEEERVDNDGLVVPAEPEQVFTPNPYGHLPVYKTIHRIRRLILASIDDPYTLVQLRDPRINTIIVRPLVDKLYEDGSDISVVYCLLVNRVRFLHEQGSQAHHHQGVNTTRANLCQLVASKILRRFDADNSGRPGLLLLANVLVAGFEPFQNAPSEVLRESRGAFDWTGVQKRGGYEGKFTALEIAIISDSKHFLAGSACQKVVDAVYRGRVVYTPIAFLDIIPDHYKFKPVSLYDPRKAPILNHYRLIVPRTRNIVDICQFIVLIVLYAITMANRDHTQWTWEETIFAVYAAGWVVDELATILEHGWSVYTQNLWSFLDITFVVIYCIYLALRLYGWTKDKLEMGRQALDVLAVAAPVLLPRLAFNVMPENMLFISLRAMMGHFTLLTLIAGWCFAGFLLSLRWLSMGNIPDDTSAGDMPKIITTAKYMLWIWFGLDGSGIDASPAYHLILGPTLMVTFAFLGNTLFLTILVAILSDTFSKIAADAEAEIQFRRAVLTFEGVKSDAIFAYRPPFNIVAAAILVPLKFFVSARWFHKVNVAAVRVLNAPILLLISLYERRSLWKPVRRGANGIADKTRKFSLWNFGSFSVHGDIQAVFEAEPPQDVVDAIEEEDELEEDVWGNGFGYPPARGGLFRDGSSGNHHDDNPSPGQHARRRRYSSMIPTNTDGAGDEA